MRYDGTLLFESLLRMKIRKSDSACKRSFVYAFCLATKPYHLLTFLFLVPDNRLCEQKKPPYETIKSKGGFYLGLIKLFSLLSTHTRLSRQGYLQLHTSLCTPLVDR